MKRTLRLLVGLSTLFQLGMPGTAYGMSALDLGPAAITVATDSIDPELAGIPEDLDFERGYAAAELAAARRGAGSATPVFELRGRRSVAGRLIENSEGLPPRAPSRVVTPVAMLREDYPATEDTFLTGLYIMLKQLSVPPQCITVKGYEISFNYGLYRDLFFRTNDIEFVDTSTRTRVDNFGNTIHEAIKDFARGAGVKGAVRVFVMESRLSPMIPLRGSANSSPVAGRSASARGAEYPYTVSPRADFNGAGSPGAGEKE